jgi:transposase
MIKPNQICCAVPPIDMRWGVDGLALWVQQHLGCAPCDGTAYLFCNKARNRIKLICWDGNGVWLCARRLNQGSFHWATSTDLSFTLDLAQWQWLIAGVDWQRLHAQVDRNMRL